MFNKSLLPLALGGFGIGMSEFVMMGILPDIAASLRITIPQAGYLISAYALGVVFGAPLLVGLLSKRAPRGVLIWFMLLVTAFNTMSALAPNFELLMITRFLAGLPHGAFFGVGAVVAMRLASEGKSASAVATMFAGLAFASVLGVPFGTWLGHNVSWRLVFIIVAAIGLATMLTLNKLVPYLDPPQGGSFRQDLLIFRTPQLWLAMAITSIGTGGFFAYISYIAPLLIEVTKFSANTIPMVMMVIGIGMTTGVLLGGKLADRVAPLPALLMLLCPMAAVLLLNGVMIASQPAMLMLAFATGAIALALGPPIQMLLMEHSKGSEMLGSSLGQSGFNIGNALGALLGGVPLTLGYSYVAPQWVACGLALCGVALVLLMLGLEGKQRMASVPA
ncbi:MFS transporter [Massilia eurypsychrophila]|uniref:MFS transporter n=1 Tax=Massilia eurypsychrophila TaxID=1485217 RepID=A0A2G8T8T6_9BURK|nr:MFS transporter [Massilia eurypsychrophila]PIL42476.1 MFS transporter [Massilia eurypsychrophila]